MPRSRLYLVGEGLMVGYVKELKKKDLYRVEWDEPFRLIVSISRGRVATSIKDQSGETREFPNERGCQFKRRVG